MKLNALLVLQHPYTVKEKDDYKLRFISSVTSLSGRKQDSCN